MLNKLKAFLELVQSRAKEPKLNPSLRLAYVPLARSGRIGFIGAIYKPLGIHWQNDLAARCKTTGLALS